MEFIYKYNDGFLDDKWRRCKNENCPAHRLELYHHHLDSFHVFIQPGTAKLLVELVAAMDKIKNVVPGYMRTIVIESDYTPGRIEERADIKFKEV